MTTVNTGAGRSSELEGRELGGIRNVDDVVDKGGEGDEGDEWDERDEGDIRPQR